MMSMRKGQDLTPLLSKPVHPDFTKNRGGVLFCYSQLIVHDPAFTKTLYTMIEDGSVVRADQFKKIETFPIDWWLRVSIRSIVDERYKFSRYFSFKEFNTPKTIEELKAKMTGASCHLAIGLTGMGLTQKWQMCSAKSQKLTQCEAVCENKLMTNTPPIIMPMPMRAGMSSF